MKKFIAVALAELVLLTAGALGNRMFPDVPTWALVVAIAALLAGSTVFFLWALRDQSKGMDDIRKMLREELSAKDVQIAKLKEVARKLPQKPLGDGHTYATLPDGTNIVTMADGTVRLALPVRLSAAFSGGLLGSLSATVTKAPPPEEGKPDVD